MKSNLNQLNALDALFKSTRQHIFLKLRSKPSQHLFSIIDLAKWALRIKNIYYLHYEYLEQRGGRANCLSPKSSQKKFTWFECALLIRSRKYMN